MEAPEIIVYDKSRKAAENKASKKFLRTADRESYRNHPLARTKAVTIEVDYDRETKSFVTFVKELHGISTFGENELQALDNTAEMIRGYIKSMQAHGNRIPLGAGKLAQLKRLLGLR